MGWPGAAAVWSTSRSGQRAGAAVGFPKFKAKHCAARSVRFTTGAIGVEADRHHVTLPRLGTIRTHESTRKLARRLAAGTARILSATVSVTGGRWQCAFQVIVAAKTRPAHAGRSPHRVVGVDVGVKDLLVVATSDGVEVARIAAPKPLTRAQSRLRAAQRRAARRCGPYDPETKTRREPSKRWQRANARVGRIHATVAAIRAQEIHQATTALATRHEVVAVEKLSAKNLGRRGGRRKRGLNRALGECPRADPHPTGLQNPLVWHRVGDRATVVSVHSTVFTLRSENQTPPAGSHLSLPQRMPSRVPGFECGDQPRPPQPDLPQRWSNGDRYRQ